MYFGAWSNLDDLPMSIVLVVAGFVMTLVAFMFMHLTVRDEGDALAVRYGPLPVFRARFRYVEITDAESSRSSVMDGWGIHWIPGRGWTYNLWGFQCVKLRIAGNIVRIGSDDVENLLAFLTRRIPTAKQGK